MSDPRYSPNLGAEIRELHARIDTLERSLARALQLVDIGNAIGPMSVPPATPPADVIRIYNVLTSGGKNVLKIKWDDGVTSTLATQP